MVFHDRLEVIMFAGLNKKSAQIFISNIHKNLPAMIDWMAARHHTTRDAVAANTGISHQTIANWANGKSDPQLRKLIALSQFEDYTLTEFIARLETGFVEADSMPINIVFGLFKNIAVKNEITELTPNALITDLKSKYTNATNMEIVQAVTEVLSIYLSKVVAEGSIMDRFYFDEQNLRRLRALIEASLAKRGISRQRAEAMFEIPSQLFSEIFNVGIDELGLRREACTKIANLCLRVVQWEDGNPILGENAYLTPEELFADITANNEHQSVS